MILERRRCERSQREGYHTISPRSDRLQMRLYNGHKMQQLFAYEALVVQTHRHDYEFGWRRISDHTWIVGIRESEMHGLIFAVAQDIE